MALAGCSRRTRTCSATTTFFTSSFLRRSSSIPLPRRRSSQQVRTTRKLSHFRIIAPAAASSAAGGGADDFRGTPSDWTDADATDTDQYHTAGTTTAAKSYDHDDKGKKKRLALALAVFLLVTTVAAGGCSSVLAAIEADPKLSLGAAAGVRNVHDSLLASSSLMGFVEAVGWSPPPPTPRPSMTSTPSFVGRFNSTTDREDKKQRAHNKI